MYLKVSFLLLVAATGVILAKPSDPQDPQPLKCPDDEVYYKCELIQCYKTCDHIKNAPACPSITPGCNKPACLCKAGFLRNSEGKCVHEDECFSFSELMEQLLKNNN